MTEWELLRLYLDRRDEDAFRAIVMRHGPMVMAVCRRVLTNPSDVEDTFQATFLVLVRKAGSVRVEDSLGRWLHGVGVRVALRARAAEARRGLDLGARLAVCAGRAFLCPGRRARHGRGVP